MFLNHIRSGDQITEFYPNELPSFCVGCKNCFIRGEENCPHSEMVDPIWSAFLKADLLIFAYPVYALRAPASIKSLLDHFCVHWMVHRPNPRMFKKTAVIITNSSGAPNGSAQKDVKTSMLWMGISKMYTCGAGMMGDVIWHQITNKHKKILEYKIEKLANKVAFINPRLRKSLKVNILFSICKILHKEVLKSELEPSLDNKFFIEKDWIKDKRK